MLPERERLLALARRLDAETVQLCYQIALQGRDDLPLAPDEHAGFVMTLLRMLAFRPEAAPAVQVAGASLSRRRRQSRQPAVAQRRRRQSCLLATRPGRRCSRAIGRNWCAVCRFRAAARELARNSALSRHADGVIELVVPKSMGHLTERNYQEKLKAALEQHFGRQIVAQGAGTGEVAAATAAVMEAEDREARRADAARTVQGDRFVKDLVDMFDAKVVGSSVRANGDKN